MKTLQSLAALAVVACLLSNYQDGNLSAAEADKVDFVKDVQPIFKKHCYECHSGKKREGGLRLNRKTDALRGGDSGLAIQTQNANGSLLIELVSGSDPDRIMPPEGDRLTPKEIETLKRWITSGANWPADADSISDLAANHWSFQPVKRPNIPESKTADTKTWIRNPIDAFVLAKLQSAGMKPSAAADKRTLIRRLSIDLLGVLPTAEEVEAFVKDSSEKAYEKRVDRLLKSPHFGERWGRHWLDLARYADSDGYEKDRPRLNAWRYRDWVINAINDDMPFDQFTIEQLAGDLLPNATEMQKLATAFHRQTLTNTEGGTDQEQFRVEAVNDRVSTTSTVWLGLTMACAQCHTHKYDPISQSEYYQFFAFFNNGDETNTSVHTSDEAVAKYKLAKAKSDNQIKSLQEKVDHHKTQLSSLAAEWEKELQAQLPGTIEYHAIKNITVKAQSSAAVKALDDGSFLVSGKNEDKDSYPLEFQSELAEITGFKLETLSDESLPSKGPGRTDHGNFVLTEFKVESSTGKDKSKFQQVPVGRGEADFNQKDFPPKNAFDGDEKTGWAIAPQMGKDHSARFLLKAPIETKNTPKLKVTLSQQYGGKHTIGRFRLTAITGTELPKPIREILAIAADKRNDKQQSQLLDFYFSQEKTGKQLLDQLAKLQKAIPKDPVLTVRVISQRTKDARKTYVLRRGDFLQPIKETEIVPGTIEILHDFKQQQAKATPTRLELAQWLIAPSNPLTPRVTVNHIWQHLFGVGIVSTPDDFGVRGEKPTHPQLLDWLASEFIRLKWSRKEFIKLVVLSATYRQSSHHRPEFFGTDPTNKLLHRQNRFRVEAEIVRDLYLTASGLLSRKVGGPSVFPPMPADVAALSYAGNFKWTTSKGEDRYRRGTYTFVKRTSPFPNSNTFDCPDGNTAVVTRGRSNTPLQALTTLNNSVYVESAQALAKRLMSQKLDSDSARLDYIFRRSLARPATELEQQKLLGLFAEGQSYFKQHAAEANKLTGQTVENPDSFAQSAAWVTVCRIILNFDEFLTRE